MKKYIVDRFENDIAILENENGNIEEFKKNELCDCSEGDILIKYNGEFSVDKDLTEKRKNFIADKQNSLFN